MVNVWACEQRLLLAQQAVEGAPEEIAGMRDLHAVLELKGALVCGVALKSRQVAGQESGVSPALS